MFGLFKKKEITEVKVSSDRKLIVKPFLIHDEADTMDAVQHIGLGTTIAFVKIKNHLVMREALVSLKKASTAVGGDIVGLPDNWFIIVPKGISLVKKSADAGKQVAEAVMSKEQKKSELEKAQDEFSGRITVLDEIDTY